MVLVFGSMERISVWAVRNQLLVCPGAGANGKVGL